MAAGTPILCGPDNMRHMHTEHSADFEKYGSKINEIIASSDYICKHPKMILLSILKYSKMIIIAVPSFLYADRILNLALMLA